MFFSIIIPCYNVEEYINDALLSVFEQTCQDFEIIAVNDGSTDKTLSILNEYARLESRLKIIDGNNYGVSTARNKGLLSSVGDYVIFLDGDDMYDLNFLDTAKNVLKTNNYDIFASGFKEINENLTVIGRTFSSKKYDKKVLNNILFLKEYFIKNIIQHLCATVFKRTVLLNSKIIFDINTKRGEDQEFIVNALLASKSIYYDKRTFYLYRQRESSVMHELYGRDNSTVDDRIEKTLPKEVLPYFHDFLCINFVSLIRKVLKGQTEKGTVKFAVEYDDIFKKYRLKKSKFCYITAIYIIFYKLYFRKKVKQMAEEL